MATCAFAPTSTGTAHVVMAFLTTFSSVTLCFSIGIKKKSKICSQSICTLSTPFQTEHIPDAKRLLIEFKFVCNCGRVLFYWVRYKNEIYFINVAFITDLILPYFMKILYRV